MTQATDIITRYKPIGADNMRNKTNKQTKAFQSMGDSVDGSTKALARQQSFAQKIIGQYAGLATGVFAATAAFRGLSEAAQVSQTLTNLNALGNQIAESGDKILETVQAVTKGQVAIQNAAASISLGFASGFSSEQIVSLADVATRASKALGIDLNNAYGRITKAAAKRETELLDELGIFARLQPAANAYARTLGVSVTSLTEFQRTQAFANAVIEEGTRKFSIINTEVETSFEIFRRFAIQAKTALIQVGIAVSDVVAPAIVFLSNNIATATTLGGIFAASLIAKMLPSLKSVRAAIVSTSASLFTLKGLLASPIRNIGLLAGGVTLGIITLTGKTDELNSVLKTTGALIKSAFTTRRSATANTFSGIVSKELKVLEDVNAELRNTDSFRITRKTILGITIDEEKSKADLVKEVSKFLSKAVEDESFIDKVFSQQGLAGAGLGALAGAGVGTLVAGPLGTLIGGVVGTVAGAVAGGMAKGIQEAATAQETKAALATIGNELNVQIDKALTKGRGAVANDNRLVSSTGIAEALDVTEKQGKRVVNQLALLQRRSAEAITVETKVAADAQIDMFLNSLKYLKNMEGIAKLSKITGQSSAAIAENYDIITRKTNALIETSSKIFGANINLSFIDQNAVFAQDALKNLSSETQILFNNVIRAGDAVASGVVRSVELLRTLEEGISGGINIEQFDQKFGAANTNLVNQQTKLVHLADERRRLTDKIANGSEREKRESADLLKSVTEREVTLRKSVTTGRELVSIAKTFREEVLRTNQLDTFISKFTSKESNPFITVFDLVKRTGLSTMETLNLLSRNVEDDGKKYTSFLDKVDETLMGLPAEGVQLIKKGSVEDINEIAAAYNAAGDGVHFAQVEGNKLHFTMRDVHDTITSIGSVELLPKSQVNNGQEFLSLLQAMDATAAKSLDSMLNYFTKFDSVIEKATSGAKKALATIREGFNKLDRERLSFKLNLEIDTNELSRKLEETNQQNVIAELEVKRSGLRNSVDSGSILAIQEFDRISAKITEEQKNLLNLRIEHENKALADEVRLLEFDRDSKILAIARESEARNTALHDQKRLALLEHDNRLADLLAVKGLNNSLITSLDSIFKAFGVDLAQIFTAVTGREINSENDSIPAIANFSIDRHVQARLGIESYWNSAIAGETALRNVWIEYYQEEFNGNKALAEQEANNKIKAIENEMELAKARDALTERSKVAFEEAVNGWKKTISGDLKTAFADIINGTKNLRDAANDFFDSVARRIQDKALDNLSTSIVSAGFGLFGLNKGGPVPEVQKFATGGPVYNNVQHFATGGSVDTVPAMLTPGEFVLNKQAAQSIGMPTLHAMNNTGKTTPTVVQPIIKIENNSSTQVSEQQEFDPSTGITTVILQDAQNNGRIIRSIRENL